MKPDKHHNERDLRYCSSMLGKITSPINSFYNLSCVLYFGLMTKWIDTVFILYRWNHQLPHIQRTNHSSRSSSENRASQRILPWGAAFYLSTSSLPFLRSCFPTVGPFVFMSPDTRVSRCHSTCCIHNIVILFLSVAAGCSAALSLCLHRI